MNIIIMGPQGSGKTTQARLLAEKLGVPLIVVGDIFRELAKEDMEQGRQVQEVLKRGELVSDEETIDIVTKRLSLPDCAKGFVLDGFPRNLVQAQDLAKKIDKVFYLKVSDKMGIERLLLRGRLDDTKDLIEKRLEIYHQETEPVLEFYKKQGVLEEVNGESTIEEIFRDILKRLNG